ncbi:MAG: DUF1501 domain-containing protein [Acidobacteriota bacterium]|nr:DUF1501 domain-containing protein [Acidobacteriota bacterium]
MSHTRRDFIRQTGCALVGGGMLAAGIQDFGLVNALAQSSATDYRALVCVFMSGGSDGNNMLVPTDDRYTGYSTARNAAGLAIPQAGQPGGLLPLNGVPYGVHPSLAGLQALFNDGKCAVLTNVGPLIEPLTKSTYQSGGRRPAQLFSHSDQVAQWQASEATNVSQTGWGGRVADRTGTLNGAATFPQMISIAGISLFVTGQATRPLAISDSRTALANVLPLTLTGSAAEIASRRTAFDQIRALAGGSLIKASADVTSSALQTSAALATANVTLTIDFPNTTLGYQLEQIARLVKLRDTLGMKRQIFFCNVGGFDTHSNQMAVNGQGALLLQVGDAIKAFYDEMVAQGVSDKVTTFTHSDFGRTLQPAGSGAAVGSDHAWGSHHFIVGGSVSGGRLYGTFPTLQLGGPDDTDSNSNPRGRWIPTTSVEQYAATLATWYGLSPNDLTTVFPFITRFSSANLGFMI